MKKLKTSLFVTVAWFALAYVGSVPVLRGEAPVRDGQPSAGKGKSGVPAAKLVTLQTAGTDIGSALRLVAEQGGLNLVIGPGVEGQVSVYLENVPVQTALRAIAVNNGYEYIMEDGVIAVSKRPDKNSGQKPEPPATITHVFTLQSQDAERVREALEYALTPFGKIKVLNENSENSYQRTSLSELSGDLEKNASAYRTTNLSQIPQPGATGAYGQGGNAQMQAPPRNARKLLVTDTKENIEHIAALIADLDRLPPQVLIEARIVEMSVDLQRQLGIDWDVNVLANGPVLNHTLPLEWRAGFSGGDQIRYNTEGVAQTANPMALGTIDFSRFQAMLRIHQQDNSIRLLANPRLLVFNNHSASILVGERYPILRANITDQGTLTEAFDTYIPVGIQLEVTPSIMSDGRVSMLVHPSTSALGDDVVGTTGLRIARILTREIDTRIIMSDGQTIVLGGLISDRSSRTVRKIPGLGDVPGLDLLFRQENPASQRVDLLIFLTARVDTAAEISDRDREIFEQYKPHFKHSDQLQSVPLHFEIPTEYESPKPMFGEARYQDSAMETVPADQSNEQQPSPENKAKPSVLNYSPSDESECGSSREAP